MKYSQITYNNGRIFPGLASLINVPSICVDFKFNSKSFIEYHLVQITNSCLVKRLYVISNKTISLFNKLFACYQSIGKMSLKKNGIERIDIGNPIVMDNNMDNPNRLPNFIEYSSLFISDESRFEVNQLLKKYTFPNVYN